MEVVIGTLVSWIALESCRLGICYKTTSIKVASFWDFLCMMYHVDPTRTLRVARFGGEAAIETGKLLRRY